MQIALCREHEIDRNGISGTPGFRLRRSQRPFRISHGFSGATARRGAQDRQLQPANPTFSRSLFHRPHVNWSAMPEARQFDPSDRSSCRLDSDLPVSCGNTDAIPCAQDSTASLIARLSPSARLAWNLDPRPPSPVSQSQLPGPSRQSF